MSVTRRLGLSKSNVADAARQAGLMLLSLLNSEMRECIRRCAVPLTFDRATYDELLRPEGGPTFEQMQLIAQLRPVPSEPDRIRMADGTREAGFALWWEGSSSGAYTRVVSPELAELAGHLADRAQEQGRLLEELDVRLLHDPRAAAALLTRLFEEADKNHDLSRCRVVLDVLDSDLRRPLLDPDVAELRSAYSTHLTARKHWAKEFYRSAFYIPRPEAEAKLDALLSGAGPRMMELFADGGMGKTMQLRWFIARHCVPNGIACARIDFDEISPIVVARHPWLLLLEAAAQLDNQLDRLPFQELLGAHGHYRALLVHTPDGDERLAAPRMVTAEDAEDVRARFVAALARVSHPVVLVLDTFEEVLHSSVEPGGILAELSQAVDRVPGLGIVVAGRYPLAKRTPEDLPMEFGSCRLEPLTPDEQTRYLRDIRGIDDEDVVRQIQLVSEGRPLTLSIYADLVSRASDLTAEEVASWVDPGIVAAIQRYVLRVDNPRVQWLIRYGVIPRRLRFPFVQAVLWPFLSEGMAGKSSLDDPGVDTEAVGLAPVFRTDLPQPADEPALREIWSALRGYASDYGWLYVPDDEPEAVAFRSDVVRSLRELIRRQPVFSEIQRQAAEYFEQRATEDPDQWLAWTREAVYHRFHEDSARGERACDEALARARQKGKEDWCLDLATSLLHEHDFVDRRGRPVHPMTAPVLARLHIERARAASSLATKAKAGPEDPSWDEVEAGLLAARSLAEEDSDVLLPELPVTIIEAQLQLGRGNSAGSAQLIRDLDQGQGASADMAELERALGMALLRAHDSDGIEHLESSYRLAVEAGDVAGARDSVVALLDGFDSIPNYAKCLAVLRQARDDEVVPFDDAQFALAEASILAMMGLAAEVRRSLAQVEEGLDEVARPAAHLIRAWAELRSHGHYEALQACELASQEFAGVSWWTADDASLALAIKGAVNGEILRVNECTSYLLAGAARARELRDHGSAADYAALAADYLLAYAGDLDGARQCLDEAERSPAEEGSEGWVRTQLVRVSLRRRLGQHAAAQTLMEGVLSTLERGRFSPRALASALVHALSVESMDQAELTTRLVHTAQEVPAFGRSFLLDSFRYVGRLHVDAADKERLKTLLYDEVVADADYARLTDFERAAFEWRSAEALRVLGFAEQARMVLDSARDGRGGDAFAWWRWVDGLSRVGPGALDEPAPPPGALEPGGNELAAVCQILLAERRMDIDPTEETAARLQAAGDCLGRVVRLDHWVGRLAMARAQLERRRADEDAAHRSAAEAADAYSRLGDATNFGAVATSFELEGQREDIDRDTIQVRFSLPTPESAHVQLTHPDGTVVERTVSNTEFGDTRDFSRSLSRLRTVLEPLTQGWRHWSETIGETILVPEVRRDLGLAAEPVRDVKLQFDVRDLAALPWELVRAADQDVPLVQAPGAGVVYRGAPTSGGSSHRTRALQQTLRTAGDFPGAIDGLYGPITRDAVRRFQASEQLEVDGFADRRTWAALRARVVARSQRRPLRGVVLQIGAGREVGRQRGYAAFGTDPATVYANHDWDVEIWEDFRHPAFIEDAHTLASEQPPDLVHIVAPIRLSGGSTILDLAGDATVRQFSRDSAMASVLSVTGLSDLLSLLGGRTTIPIVVLDVPLPQSPLELVRSLGLRNSFAYQLLRLGAAEAVLGTGLAQRRSQVEILERIVGGIADGEDITAVARGLQRARPCDEPGAAGSFCATALYLERPPFTYLPPGYLT
ncbi:MAG: hypothetical protein JWR85_1692 [Marmoricola sp.]|nr:hypothetical protein [Marmoricola sp.]